MININNNLKSICLPYLRLALEKYLTVLSLPCGFRSKSKLFIASLLSLILLSIIYSSGLYSYITPAYDGYESIIKLFI